MSNRFPDSAPDWVARLGASDCTGEERAAFQRWLDSSQENRDWYARCATVSTIPAQLAGNSEVFAKLLARADAVPDRDGSRRGQWAMAMAAGVATLAIALGSQLFRERPAAEPVAAALASRNVVLSDGSAVTLNSRTSISAAFSASERRVEMTTGEAFFDVRGDAARPFVVRIGNSEVRVVGTQFNVRQAHGELEVVVREGLVIVVPDATVAPSKSVPRIELGPGERLRMATSDNKVTVAQVDPERLTAWRTGMIKFQATALADVIADVNRYADKPLVIANDSLRALPVSGRFRVGDTANVRFLLRERFGIESVDEADRIVLR